MKKRTTILTVATALLVAFLPAASAEGVKKTEAGPRRGRLLATDTPRPEFFVEKDHTVSVKFYDVAGAIVAPTTQQITIIATGRAKKKFVLEKEGDALVSKEKLPDGDGYKLVVQVRANADAKPKNFRFIFANYICLGTCGNPEYACTCDEYPPALGP